MIEEKERKVLDWNAVLTKVGDECVLRATWEFLAKNPLATSIEEAKIRFAVVNEIWQLLDEGEDIPLFGMPDFREDIEEIRDGVLLDLEAWVQIKNGVEQLARLKRWLNDHFERFTMLSGEMREVELDPIVVNTLVSSFDSFGQLSESYYPQLFQLRQKQQQLRHSIEQELQALLMDTNIQAQLQEHFVTERNGRFVLPMKRTFQRKMGISHGVSRSGETVYVEPLSVLPLSNALREAEAGYEQEIRSILDSLSRLVRRDLDRILHAFQVTCQLDFKRACAVLGRRWRASIPKIGSEGVISIQNFRHPLLIGHGIKVIGNDFHLDKKQPVAIFSGPNAGGKTIALKSVGLACLMTRLGLPIPARDNLRVDFFERIFADIGDSQTVRDGLSSFSAHLLYINQVLEQANESSLVLFDEIGMGTDPAQGAVIAQAVVEQLLEQGIKMVVTTHFTRLKAMATVDDRFSVAAMEFVDGKPTYKLLWGEVGESHALSLAKRMALPENLLWRARELLSSSERKVVNLVEELENQRKELKHKEEELDFLKQDYQTRVHRLERKERILEEQQEKIKEQALSEFRSFLHQKEQEAKQVMKLLEAANSPKEVKKQLKGLKEIKREISPKKPKVASISPHQNIEVGDIVDVITLGCKGTIQKILGKNRFEASINGFAMVLSRDEIAGISQRSKPQKVKTGGVLEREKSIATVMRSSQNTCDVRGCRVEEAFQKIEAYFDQKILEKKRTIFILHGHGTGALKKAIRTWLPSSQYVQSWRVAEHAEGGDAFTVVEI